MRNNLDFNIRSSLFQKVFSSFGDTGGSLSDALGQVKRLKDIINRSPMILFIWRVSENWEVEYVSENVSQLGYTAEDFTTGRVSWPGITYEEDVPRLEEEVSGFLSSGVTEFSQKYRLHAKDDSIRWVEDRNTVLRDKHGDITHIQGIVFETTAHRQVRDELADNQRRVQALLDAAHESLIVIDTNGIIQNVNSTTAQRHGKAAKELIGTSVWDLFPSEIVDSRRKQLEKAFDTREPIRFQDRRGDRWFDSTICPIVDDSDRVTAAAVFGEDITARVAADKALKEAYEHMEELVRKRTAELAQVNAELVVEREALNKKNEALREVLDQIESTKSEMGQRVESNINRLVMPILREMGNIPNLKDSNYLSLLRSTIEDAVSPFLGSNQVLLSKLSEREVEICNMIKRGFGSKQIAEMLHTSTQTVLKQRKMIRKKLSISGKKVNLASFLKLLK